MSSSIVEESGGDSRGGGWMLAALVGAAFVGFCTVQLGRRGTSREIRGALREPGSGAVGGPRRPPDVQIVRGIVGASRQAILKRFGPPVAASEGDYGLADVWYYPVDGEQRTALAIVFRRDIAREIECIRAPAQELSEPIQGSG